MRQANTIFAALSFLPVLIVAGVMATMFSGCDVWTWQDPASDGDMGISDGDKETNEMDKEAGDGDKDIAEVEKDTTDGGEDGDISDDDMTDGDTDGDMSDGDEAPDGDTDGDMTDGDAAPDGDTDGDMTDGDAAPDGDTDGDMTDGDAAPDGDVDQDAPSEGELTELDTTETEAETEPEMEDLVCAEGICTDPATGFEWQETPTGGTMDWDSAVTHCQNLDLDGKGWRLPNISELRTLVRNCDSIATGGACGVKDVCAPCGDTAACLDLYSCWENANCAPSSCVNNGGSMGCYWPQPLSGTCTWFWSSSLRAQSPDRAWYVDFYNGIVDEYDKNSSFKDVRCVRSMIPGFVRINAGTFMMGSPLTEAGRGSDETQHSVTLTYDFEMEAKEVTQAEFTALMGYNPSYFNTGGGGTNCGTSCPVEQVSWAEACAYANALSVQKGYSQCYDCTGTQPNFTCTLKTAYSKPQDCPGFRLPTESEWEYAARAGTTSAYHNGQDSDSGHIECEVPFHLTGIAWYCANANNTTHPVGTKTANSWGLYDMSGNVNEWVWDGYGTYPGTVIDPTGATSGSARVNRGGGWYYYAKVACSAARNFYDPGYRSNSVGFRLVRSLNPSTPGFTHIGAGAFTMGSPSGEAGRGTDETQHSVTLTYSFEMQAKEVTQGEFTAFAGTNPSWFGPNADGADCGDNCPVERVNWYEALAYANWLSTQKGLTPCYVLTNCTGAVGGGCAENDGVCIGYSCTASLNGVSKPQDCQGFRLPTEAEWEYAIRAGSMTAFYNGEITNTGQDTKMDLIGWYYYNSDTGSGRMTHPGGGKTANAWGLYDMSGNVQEWVWNWYQDAYETDVGTNPVGLASGSYRVTRGGNRFDHAKYCRSAARSHESPVVSNFYIGFRLVRTLP